jgi:hypothetical protein
MLFLFRNCGESLRNVFLKKKTFDEILELLFCVVILRDIDQFDSSV